MSKILAPLDESESEEILKVKGIFVNTQPNL